MMEEFTSLDPEPEIMTEDPEIWDQVEVLEENLFMSDQEQGQGSSQSEDQSNLLNETRQIKDLLRDYLVETTSEESTEETTDYIELIYKELKNQNENIGSLEGKVITIAKDQQTIGLLSVGATVLLIGALSVFFFLWRIR